MRRSTAIRHLVEMAEVASDQLRLRDTEIGWPLVELWVTGELLEPGGEVDHGTVVLMIDLPPHELPWLTVHPTAEWIASQLRLGKRPMGWSYRPIAWPPWTYRHRRLARFWSDNAGLDHTVIDALRSGDAHGVSEPRGDELLEQLRVELEVSSLHLRSILDRYWDHDWRRANRGDTSPEDQLWRAATAVTEIEDAVAELTS